MQNLDPLDEAKLKVDMRAMHRKIGTTGSLRCLFEILKSAQILVEVIDEDQDF